MTGGRGASTCVVCRTAYSLATPPSLRVHACVSVWTTPQTNRLIVVAPLSTSGCSSSAASQGLPEVAALAVGRHEEMKRLPLTLPAVGSTYPFDIDGSVELRTIESVDLGRGLMFLASNGHPLRPTFINDVVRMVRPNDAAAWLPAMREHYTMDAEGRGALIAEAKQAPRTTEEDLAWVDSLERGPYTPMGPVCHNGEDLARAFPQVPNDLSRDLYATIGSPVPALVWPRQEVEQSPTRSETTAEAPIKVLEPAVVSEPGMPCAKRVEDFAVGDRVTVGKKVETLSNGRDAGWDSKWMDETVGQQGRVNDAVGTRVLVQLDDGCEYAYAPEALALENACSEVTTEPPAVEVSPAKPRAYKVGDKVKVARAVMRDRAGHWCFWTGALEMTIGCTGEVLALAPNETAGAYLYIRVDGHEFYYSPEALDLITE